VETIEAIARLFPTFGTAIVYAGSVSLFFNKIDERFPSIKEPILDWITRRDRDLPFGRIYIWVLRAGLGEGVLSFRRVLFSILSVLLPVIGLAVFSRKIEAITLPLFGDTGADIIRMSNGIFLESVFDVIHPVGYDFRWMLSSAGPMLSLLTSMIITLITVSIFVYIMQRKEFNYSWRHIITAYVLYLAIIFLSIYFETWFIKTYFCRNPVGSAYESIRHGR
jgi:hypothetical protein